MKVLKGWILYETRLKIRGEKGHPSKFEIKRAGIDNPLEFNMVRAEIPLDTVFSSIKEVGGEQIGYIELTAFSENTASDFKKQIKKLAKDGNQGLGHEMYAAIQGGTSFQCGNDSWRVHHKDKALFANCRKNGNTIVFISLESEKLSHCRLDG